MASLSGVGRPKRHLDGYIKQEDTQDGYLFYACLGKNCATRKKTRVGRPLPYSQWCKHIVCECTGFDMDSKMKIASSSTQKDVKEWLAQANNNNNKDASGVSVSFSRGSGSSTMVSQLTNENSQSTATKRQSTIDGDSFFDRCDSARATRITKAVTKFLVGCAIPFHVVESCFFVAMVNELNAAYSQHLPKVDAFRRTHLPHLFQETVEKIDEMWRKQARPLLTMGYDGYTGPNSNNVLNVTETAQDLTAFKVCIDPGERAEDSQFIATQIMNEMEKVTQQQPPRLVEDVYVGTVGDNVSCNRAAARLIEARYPKLLHPGCCAHVLDLLIEDVCKVDELASVVREARNVAVFVRGHRRVREAYKRIAATMLPKGTMPTIFPHTRFAYADLTLQRCDHNAPTLRRLIDDDDFTPGGVLKGISQPKVDVFIDFCNSPSKFEKITALRKITGPLCKAIHHLEQGSTRASWIYPIIRAIQEDYATWRGSPNVQRWFTNGAMDEVGRLIERRWAGEGRVVALKNDIWLVAFLMDPYYTPPPEECEH